MQRPDESPGTAIQRLYGQLRRINLKNYIGTKIINASPMTRLAYNQLRGWMLPANENGDGMTNDGWYD